MSSETGTLASPQEGNEVQLELWQEMVSVERERIASRDRTTDVMYKTIEQQNAENQRYHDYAIEKMRRDDEHRQGLFATPKTSFGQSSDLWLL